MIEFTFIRHAETQANRDHAWQGQGDSPLSERGRAQAGSLGERLDGHTFDLVLASDLGRVLETAGIAGLDPTLDPRWREVDIGSWEGLDRLEVDRRFPDEVAALRRGEEVAMGGGESWPTFGSRIRAAFADLRSEVADGSRVAIVAHGGVVSRLVASTLGLRGYPWPIDRVRNASISRIRIDDAGSTVVVFNDAAHVSTEGHPDERGPLVHLVRHGQTEANVAGRWQGRTDGSLTERGRAQGVELASWFGGVEHVYASPLRRASDTANAYAGVFGLDMTTLDDLVETDFGEWEDLSPAEIRRRWPAEWERTYVGMEDIPRGATGETLGQSAVRLTNAVAEVLAAHPDGACALFSHGGAIRAYAAALVGLDHTTRNRIAIPANAAPSTVRVSGGRTSLVDYNIGQA